MLLLQKPMFRRAYKKLFPKQRMVVDEEIRKIMNQPTMGEEKKQDLAGVFVHKFKIEKQQYLLSYMFAPETLTLLFLGVHENYYRDLKRKSNH